MNIIILRTIIKIHYLVCKFFRNTEFFCQCLINYTVVCIFNMFVLKIVILFYFIIILSINVIFSKQALMTDFGVIVVIELVPPLTVYRPT